MAVILLTSRGDLLSGVLILKRLNKGDSLGTRKGSINDKMTQAREIESRRSDGQQLKRG